MMHSVTGEYAGAVKRVNGVVAVGIFVEVGDSVGRDVVDRRQGGSRQGLYEDADELGAVAGTW